MIEKSRDDERMSTIPVYRDYTCARREGAKMDCSQFVMDTAKRTKEECGKHPRACVYRVGDKYRMMDRGARGKGKKVIDIEQDASLTNIFNNAGIRTRSGNMLGEGDVINAMSQKNCRIVGDWMYDNVKKWNEKGKNPKTEGRMKIQALSTLMKRTDPNKAEKAKSCASIVADILSHLPPTPRE